MLGFLSLLFVVGALQLQVRADYNYKISGSDGSTFILSTSKKVDAETKKKILSLNGADAYNKFMDQYGGLLENPRLMMSGDPSTQTNRETKRKKNFVSNLAVMKRHNAEKFNRGRSHYEATINTFTVTDEWDRSQFLGAANLTAGMRPPPIDDKKLEACRDRDPEATCHAGKLKGKCSEEAHIERCEMTCGKCGAYKLPEYLDWASRGMVTQAKSQGKCGSCWSFSANVVLEWMYVKTTGDQIQFSEQELLDCTYPDSSKKDGCNGGLPHEAWAYVKRRGGLSPMAEYEYVGLDGICYDYQNFEARFGNPMKEAFRMGQATMLPRNIDMVVIEALNVMPLSVAIWVSNNMQDSIYTLGDGIYDGCPPGQTDMNHAVALVGYGPNYYTFKNSWGPDWGVNGYGKILRAQGTNMCGVLNYVYYIDYTDLNPDDGIADFPREAVYEDEEEDPECLDLNPAAGECPYWAEQGFCDTGSYVTWMSENCKRSCKLCNEEEEVVVECDAGYFVRGKECFECPVNTYNSDPTATECAPCPAGSRSGTGSESVTSCEECGPGQKLEGNSCVECPENTYSGYGATECAKCPDGTKSQRGSESASDCKSPPSGCEDALALSECEGYKNKGLCADDTYSFLSWACKKTCVFCVDEEEEEATESGECMDTDSDCTTWYEYGYCKDSEYTEYVKVNCPLACGFCSDGGNSDCKDTDPGECPGWAESGLCASSSKYHEWMVENCAKSCETCEGGDGGDDCTYDADNNKYCESWKDQGYCTDSTYRDYMRDTCSTSCGICKKQEEEEEEEEEEQGSTSNNCGSDKDNNCADYANQGYCSHYSYKQWMSQNCQSSCGSGCRGACEDKNQHCGSWASSGECSRNPYYMKANCRASCNYCTRTSSSSSSSSSSSCNDYNSYCTSWYSQGYCYSTSTYYSYMQTNCPKTCGFCSGGGGGGGGSTSTSCNDYSTYCASWAQYGYCSSNAAYMRTNCAKSCGICGGGGGYQASSCADSASYASSCYSWYYAGYCSSNYAFMSVNCKKTCGLC